MASARTIHISIAIVACLGAVETRAQVPMGTAFNYQGQLNQNGAPVNATCDFEFSLFNDPDLFAPANQAGSAMFFDGMGENPAPISVTSPGSGRLGPDFFAESFKRPSIPGRRFRPNNRVLANFLAFFRDSGFALGGFWCVTQ